MNNNDTFFVTGGTLKLRDRSYVTRPADHELLERVSNREFCYILTSRQMGKSSLMIRTIRRLREQGWRTAIFDLTGTGTEDVSVDEWYLGLLTRISHDLRLSTDLETWWSARSNRSITDRFLEFLRDELLANINEPVALFIDEIDSSLKLDFTDDFFAAIRAVYNLRAQEKDYYRLTFILLGVARPTDLIKDQNRTPFNIGHGIDLKEFSREDAEILANGLDHYHPDQGAVILDRILYWTNGHPYLTQKLCRAATKVPQFERPDEQIDRLADQNFFSSEIREEPNLKFVQSEIQDRPKGQQRRLLRLYRRVYGGESVPADERSLEQNYLMLFGLVRNEQGFLRVRNEIYRRVFNPTWIRNSTPSNTQQWVAIAATVVAFLLLATVITVIFTRSDPPAIRAQVCKSDFQQATSAAVQIDALACLFELGAGYDEEGRALFYELEPANQQYLFVDLLDNVDLQALENQIVDTVRGIYVALEQTPSEHDTKLMGIMTQVLSEIDNSIARQLVTELTIWQEGRRLVAQGNLQQAISQYTLALDLNERHSVILYDRAMANAGLERYDLALADLEKIVEEANKAPPTPTPTPVQPTDTPTVPPSPTVTNTSAPDGGSEIPLFVTITPNSGIIPTPTIESIVAQSEMKFINADRTKETVINTILENEGLLTYYRQNQADFPELTRLIGRLPAPSPTPTEAQPPAASPAADEPLPAEQTQLRQQFDQLNGRFKLELYDNSDVIITEAASGQEISQFSAPVDAELWDGVALSPDGRRLIVIGSDAIVYVIDTDTGQIIYSLEEHTDRVTDAVWSPDGTRILTGGLDATARLWDAATGQAVTVLRQEWPIRQVSFSPDGALVATAGVNNTVHVFDATSGEQLALIRQEAPVTQISFSADGSGLVTVWADGITRIWNPATGELLSSSDGAVSATATATANPTPSPTATSTSTSTPAPTTSTPVPTDETEQLVFQRLSNAPPLGSDKGGLLLVNCTDLNYEAYITQPVSEQRFIGLIPAFDGATCGVSNLEPVFSGFEHDLRFDFEGIRFPFTFTGVQIPPGEVQQLEIVSVDGNNITYRPISLGALPDSQ